jgi:uncharacterized RDD family membrane protein YckC
MGTVRQVPGRYVHRFGNVPAYLLARLAAFVVDVPGVTFVCATFGFNAFDRGFLLMAGHDRAGYDTLVWLSLAVALGFAFLCESIFGTTLGKLVFGLHTRRHDGRHAGPGRVFVRQLVKPIDILVVGPFLALVTPRHQRAGDLAAGTVVGLSSLGIFASLIGILLCVGIGFAQVTYGGGLNSALGVAAETANFAPDFFARTAGLIGTVLPGSLAKPNSSAAPVSSAVPRATAEPSAEPTAEPSAEPTADAAPVSTPEETPAPQESAAVINE